MTKISTALKLGVIALLLMLVSACQIFSVPNGILGTKGESGRTFVIATSVDGRTVYSLCEKSSLRDCRQLSGGGRLLTKAEIATFLRYLAGLEPGSKPDVADPIDTVTPGVVAPDIFLPSVVEPE